MIRRSLRCRVLVAAALAAAACAAGAQVRCTEEPAPDRLSGAWEPPVADVANPRTTLVSLVQDALTRSNAIGASKLLADAAVSDLEEMRAGFKPSASLSASVGPALNQVDGYDNTKGVQTRLSLNVSAPLYDGGRLSRLTDWRAQLAEAARYGHLGAQEQVAAQTVSLALERARYRMHVRIYQQYAQKMACLVEALETIVSADKGRTSELVQAKKTQQQAELAQAQAISSVRQVEVRLRRFVGDALPPIDGLSTVLLDVPPLDELMAQAARSNDINQLNAQVEAANAFAKAAAAAASPKLDWSVGAAKAKGAGSGNGSLSAGVSVTIPILSPGVEHSTAAARQRAEAARLQKLDALEARQSRLAELHEMSTSAVDRARRIVEVLRNSDRVRGFTIQQWQQLGRRSLFDVMSAEGDHYQLRISHVNALIDAEQSNALMWSLGPGVVAPLR